MKRLTDKHRGLCIFCELSIDDECDYLHRGEVCNNAKRYDRLAAIEDILGDDYDLDRLRELVAADRDGRCVVLPYIEPEHGDPAGHLGALGEPGIETAYREFAEDVIRQFAYHGSVNGRPAYITGGLSTLEEAFRIAEWDDPHPAPECECEEEGCHEWATGGRPTSDGYKWFCSKHYCAYEAREEAAEAALEARERNG